MTRNFIIVVLLLFPFLTRAQEDSNKNLRDSTISDTTIIHFKGPVIDTVHLATIENHIGDTITFCGKVITAQLLKKEPGKPILMTLQGELEDIKEEIRVRFKDLSRLTNRPQKLFGNKKLCFTGIMAKKDNNFELVMDTSIQYKFFQLASETQHLPTKPKTMVKQPLQTNAYLLAGPDLSEPIITHLKKGSIVIPFHFEGSWAYVQVIEKAGSNEKPVALNGFIRAHALGLKR
jgi:hypothetical protein